ncbi:hypothetical protein KUCAC02_029582 [Chaenocephalus aceratus]|nr:hypothetical protein KUCAC02_029582 [Chaenocephalus aceratus]
MRDLKETTDESSLKTLQAERISLTEEVRTYEMAVEVRESVVEKREIRRQKRDEVSSGHTRGQQVEEPEDEVEQPEEQVLNQTEEWSSRSVPPTLKKTEHVPSGRENTTPPEVTRPTKQDVIPPDTGSTSQQEVPSYKKTQQQTLVEAVPVHYEDIEELQMEDLVKPKTSSTSKEVTAPKKPKEVAIPLEHDTPQVPTQTTASPPKKEVMITREMEEICAGLEDAVPLEKPTPVSADESFEEELHPATGSIPASTEVSCPAPIRIPPPERAVYLEKDISPPKEAVLPTEKTSPKRPKASPEEVPSQKKPVTKPEVAPSQTPAVPPQKKPVTKPEVAPSQTPAVPPQKKPVTKPEVAPSQTPAVPPQKKPVTKPEVAPSQTPAVPPQKKPVTKPEVAPSQTPEVPPQKKPVTKPEVAPSQTAEVPPQKKPVTTPEVAPSQTAEVPPQKKPVTKPEVAPSQTPAVPPQKKPVTKPEVAPSQTAAVPPQKKPVTKPEVAPSQTPAVPPQKKPVTKPEVAPSQTPAEPPQKKEPPVPEEEALVVETAASLAHTVFSPELDSAQEVRSSPREGDEKAKKSKEQSLQTASPPEDGKPAAPKSSPPAGSLCEAHESVSSSRLRQRTGNQLQLQLRHRSVLLLQCLVRRKRKRLHRKLQLLQLKPLLVQCLLQRKRKRLHQRLQQIFNQVGLLVAQVSPVAKTPSPAGVRASPAASPPEDKGPVSAPGPTTDDMLSPLFVNVFTASTTVTALKHKGKIPVQETKTPESPTLKSRVLRGPKEKEPEVVTLKKVLVKPPEPEKQVVTHKAEVTKLQDVELVVHGLHERDDREIITLGRTERVFTAEEQTAQLGHFEEAERVTVTVKTTEQVGWTRTPKSQKEEEPEVPKAEKKKITKLPKADEKTDSTKLKPFEKSGKPEEEPQRIQLKKVPTKPKEPEKEVITQRCEVTRHYDSELSVQKLRHREDRELLTVVRPERVFTAAEDSPDSGHMEEPEELETEDEKSRWTRTPKAPEEEEPEPDFSKKKIKKLPKKDEEQEAVTLKPFERPKKPEAPEPAKSTEEAEAKTDTERTPYKRVETPQRGQPAAAIKHSEDQPAHSSPEVPADVGKDQVMLKPFTKPKEKPEEASEALKPKEKEPEVVTLKKVLVKPPEPEKQVVTHKAEVTKLQDVELVVHGLHERDDREIITLGRTERVFTAEEQTAQLGHFEEAERADEKKDSTKLKPFEKSGTPEEEPQRIQLKKVPTKPKEPEKEVITQRCEVTRHYDSELSVQKLRHREDRELLTVVRPERVFTAAEDSPDSGHMEEPEELETEDEKSREAREKKAVDTKVPRLAPSEEAPKDLKKVEKTADPQEDDEEEEAAPDRKASPPGKKDTPQKQADILKKAVELKKTHSPRAGKDKVDEDKAVKAIEQLKKAELRKTPSPRVETTISPKDSVEAVTLKKTPRKSPPEEAPGRGRIPLGKEVSPGAVQMQKVPTQPEEEVFEEEAEVKEGEEEDEAWGWELVPPEDWEGEAVDGERQTPGMPGARRGTGTWKRHFSIPVPTPIILSSVNIYSIFFILFISMENRQRRRQRAEAEDSGRGQTPSPGDAGRGRGLKTGGRGPTPPEDPFGGFKLKAVPLKFVKKKIKDILLLEAESIGSSAVFECEGVTPSTAITTWMKDGTNLREGPKHKFTADGKDRKLNIIDVQLSDTGDYTCVAKNAGKEITCTAKLVVEELPVKWVKDLDPETSCIKSQPMYLTCELNKEREVVWKRNGALLKKKAGKVAINIIGMQHAITIQNAMEEDSGSYTCEVEGQEDVKTTGIVKVIGKQFRGGTANSSVASGEEANTTFKPVHHQELQLDQFYISPPSGGEANTTFKPVHLQELQLDQFYTSPPSGATVRPVLHQSTIRSYIHLQELQLDQFYTSPPSGGEANSTFKPVPHQELQLDQFYTSPPSGGEANTTFKPVHHQELQLDQFNTSPPSGATELQLDQFNTSPPSGGEANTTFKPVHHQELQLDQFYTSPPSGATELQLDQFNTSPPSGGEANTTFKPVHHQELQLDQFYTSPPSGATELQLDQFNTSPPSGGEANTTFKPVHHQELQLDQFYTSPPSGATELQLDQFYTSPPPGGDANSSVGDDKVIKDWLVKPLRDQHVKPRAKATFKCELFKDTPNWKWFKGDTELAPSDKIQIEKDGQIVTLTVDNCQADDVSDYIIAVEDRRYSAKLTLGEREAEVLKPLVSQEVVEKEEANFDTEISEQDVVGEWKLRGQVLMRSPTCDIKSDGKKRFLTLKQVQLDQAGEVSYQALNAVTTAMLTVTEIEMGFVEPLKDVSVPERKQAKFECTVTKEVSKVLWFRGADIVTPSPKHEIMGDGRKHMLIINSCEFDDEAQYTVEVLGQRCSALLAVEGMRLKLVQPLKDRTAKEGQTVRFELELSHDNVPVVWYRNEVKLHVSRTVLTHVEGKRHVLEMRTLCLDDTCQIKAEAKGIHSTAKLTVIAPPCCISSSSVSGSISGALIFIHLWVHLWGSRLHPSLGGRIFIHLWGLQDYTATEKDEVSLDCELSKDVPVMWFHEETEVIASKTLLMKSEGTRRSLVLRKVEQSDKGKYVCDCGTDKTTASINIEARDIKVVRPIYGVELFDGETARFEVEISEDDVRGQWKLNGDVLTPSSVRLPVLVEYVMWTSSRREENTLILYNCKVAMTGEVAYSAANAKCAANLKVKELPMNFLTPLSDVNVYEKDEARFELELSRAAKSFRWLKGTQELQKDEKYEMIQEGNMYVLQIRSVAYEDEAKYMFEAEDKRTSGKLVIQGIRLEFAKPIKDVTVKERETAEFSVELSHDKVPVVWYKNDVRLHPSKVVHMSDHGKVHTLAFKEVTIDDTSMIKVEAMDKSVTAMLTVIEGDLYFTTKLQNYTAVEKDEVKLICELSKTTADVKWFKDGKEITPSKNIAVSTDGKKRILMVRKAEKANIGEYSCDCGSDKTAANLNIEGCGDEGGRNEASADPVQREDGYGRRSRLLRRHAKSNAQLRVKARSIGLLRPLKDVTVTAGETATFESELSYEGIAVDWFLCGKKMEASERTRVAGKVHTLTLRDVMQSEAGEVKMTSKDFKTAAQLIVRRESLNAPRRRVCVCVCACDINLCVCAEPAVEFSRPLEDQSVEEEAAARLECEVSREEAEVRWFREGQE